MLTASLTAASCSSCGKVTQSPNGKFHVVVNNEPNGESGKVSFSVICNGDTVMSDSRLGLVTDLRSFSDNLKLKSVSRNRTINDDYQMLTGKRSHCRNSANERIYTFVGDSSQIFDVTFRVYDDGITFKYSFEAIDGENLISESTEYCIPENANRWMQQYDPGYEGFYPLSTTGESTGFRNKNKWGYPALLEMKDSVFMLITEANIRRDHCGSLLSNAENRNRYNVLLGDNKLAVKGHWESPWRVLITGSLSDIVESTLVTDVSDPAMYKGDDWIKPGQVSWIYWANNHGSKDYQIIKDYIDLAADMNWPYDLVDWEWDEMANGGNIDDALSYAKEKGVKLLLWYNSSTVWSGQGAPGPLYRLNDSQKRKEEYAWLKEKGFAGVKIDFFPGDDMSTMNYYMDLLEDAANQKILVNFHGATVPRGWQRTYPNMMSVEGVYGAEWYNNGPTLTGKAAVHNATLPFTRNVIGPMDYTPGTFSDSQNPHITTYAHELALTVLFESALQHMPDRPSIYRELNTQLNGLLSDIPTAWDDTRFIAGYPGEYVIIARQKGNVWYVAGINGTEDEKELSFSTDFIDENNKEMTIVTDENSDRSLEYKKAPCEELLSVKCMPRGGFLAVIK